MVANLELDRGPGWIQARRRKRYLADKASGKAQEQYREWYARNRDRVLSQKLEYQRKRRQADPERVHISGRKAERKSRYLRQYGLTLAARAELLEASDGLCAICYDRPATTVDHDHETGKIRGMVCVACNTGLGSFRDNADFLDSASNYLQTEAVG